jgi:hypothetical protein
MGWPENTGEDVFAKITNYQIQKNDGKKVAPPVSIEEIRAYNRLYAARDKIGNNDLSEFITKVSEDTGLEHKDAIEALKRVGILDGDTGVYFTSQTLKRWGGTIPSNLSALYNYFAKKGDGPYEQTFGDFKFGGTGDNPILRGRSYDEDFRRVPWDKDALKKTEAVYNAVAKSQGKKPIDLSRVNEQKSPTKKRLSTPDRRQAPRNTKGILSGKGKNGKQMKPAPQGKNVKGIVVDKTPTIQQIHTAVIRDAKDLPKLIKAYGQNFKKDYAKHVTDLYGEKGAQGYVDKVDGAAKPAKASSVAAVIGNDVGSAQIINDIAEFAVKTFESGAKKYSDFVRSMRKRFTDIWDKLKRHIKKIFSVLDNERGELVFRQGADNATKQKTAPKATKPKQKKPF